MAKVRVQVSMLRDPIEVDESEIPGLGSQGILVGYAGETAEHGTPSGDGSSEDAGSDTAPAGATAGRKPRRTDGQ